MRYSLDTSALVGAWRRAYPPDVLPSLWDKHLPSLIGAGDLRATREVEIELEQQDDELLRWAQAQKDLFLEVDEPVQRSVRQILSSYPKLINPHSGRSGADPFVIALAHVRGCAVVTEEKPRSLVNPKIPDVCAAMGIRCMSFLDLIRDQGWRFR